MNYEAGDAAAPGFGIGAGEDHAPFRLMRVRDENLGAVEHVSIALAHRTALNRSCGVGATAWLGDSEEGVPSVFQRWHHILLHLLFAAAVNYRWRIAPEDAGSRIVKSHSMLRHFFHQHAHVETAQSTAAVFLRRTHAPHAGGLDLFGNPPIVGFRNFGGVGVESFF